MCIEVFLGSDRPLTTSEYSGECPSIQLYDLIDEHKPVRAHFSKPYVYRVGADCCSCIFQYRSHAFDLSRGVTQEQQAQIQESIDEWRSFLEILESLVRSAAQSGTAEVYSCWYSEVSTAFASQINVRPEHFAGARFSFAERELLTVVSPDFEEFTGSFTSLKQQINNGEMAYIQSLMLNKAQQRFRLSFSYEEKSPKVHAMLNFEAVQEFASQLTVNPENREEEEEEWHEEAAEQMHWEVLFGILETKSDLGYAYRIITNLREISFCTIAEPELSIL